jgi:hypothetical protein
LLRERYDCSHFIMTQKASLFRFRSVSLPMPSFAEDLGRGRGEVVESEKKVVAI